MKKEENKCNGCPCHVATYDYWGECDEWCEIHRIYKKCYYPLLIRKLLKYVWKIREEYYDWCADRTFMKDMKAEYEERVKLGMTEDEYEQMQYDEMTKDRKFFYIKRDNCWWQRVSEQIYEVWNLDKKMSYHKLSDVEIKLLK